MRVLFLISDNCWSARARAFVLAARGLAAKGHEVMLTCESNCPVQVRAAEAELKTSTFQRDTSAAAGTWNLRRTLQEHRVDVVFVHTDDELLMASSAARLGGGSAIVRRIPPFALAAPGRKARIASRLASTGLLVSTQADRAAAGATHRVHALAPLAIDPAQHDKTRAIGRATLGVPQQGRLVVCVYDGVEKRRVLTAVRTLALLAPRHPDHHLAIIGGSGYDELRMHGAALGVNRMVSYLGARDDELSIIRAADIGWVAGEGDAAAFAALDFMAFGIPVLAEREALTEHYVADGITGVLLPAADPATIASSVAAFLARPEQLTLMGTAGRTRLRREFPHETMIAGYDQAIAGAVAKTTRSVA